MIFLLDLPNPVHGMSNVNLAVLNTVTELKLKPKVINTVPSYAAKYFTTKLWFMFKLAHTVFSYAIFIFYSFFNVGKVVYRPINGGVGQVFDLVYILICKIFNNKIYLHHHSFNYLNSYSKLFFILNTLSGAKTTHIVLGKKMGESLTKLYRIESKNIKIVSNLAFFESDNLPSKSDVSDSKQPVVIGHLANLCVEKGVDLFIEICHVLNTKNIDFTAIIAGPCVDGNTETIVNKAVKDLQQITYLGPLYNSDKEAFYQGLDCFFFPSKYKNEAEPLVLYEAAINGTHIIGSRQGCMEDVINKLNGFSAEVDTNICMKMADHLIEKIENCDFSSKNKSIRINLFMEEQIKAKEALLEFIKEMEHYDVPEVK